MSRKLQSRPSSLEEEEDSEEEQISEEELAETEELDESSGDEAGSERMEDSDDEETRNENEETDDVEDKEKKEEKGASKKSRDSQYDAIRKEIAELPFEDLQKLKNKMGLKLFNQIYYGQEKKKQIIPKRANKNRPQELSSKKPPKHGRGRRGQEKVRDPRFDQRSGDFDEKLFKESYGFLDDIKSREKSKLEKMLKKETNPEKKQKISYLLNRIHQQEDTKKKKEKTLELKRKIKKAEREDLSQGQSPFYLKKSDQKKLELAEKFRELKKSGKLDKFMSKKRKKLAQKDRKKMPNV